MKVLTLHPGDGYYCCQFECPHFYSIPHDYVREAQHHQPTRYTYRDQFFNLQIILIIILAYVSVYYVIML